MSQTSPSTVLVKKVTTLWQNEENIVYVCHCTIARKHVFTVNNEGVWCKNFNAAYYVCMCEHSIT